MFFLITFIYTDKIVALKSASLHSLTVWDNTDNSEIFQINNKVFLYTKELYNLYIISMKSGYDNPIIKRLRVYSLEFYLVYA